METKKRSLRSLREYLFITFGMFLYCFSWTSFLIPKGIVGGGVTGFATVLNFATQGLLPISATYLVTNVILVITGTLILGKGFGFKTIYCILLATLLFQVLPALIPWVSDVEDNLLNAIMGGALGAIGIAVIFANGGSTGGTDIIALILAKFREISPGKVFLYCDACIIGSIIFIPEKGLSDVVYGYIQMVAFSLTVDMALTGTKQSMQMMVFSDHYKEIADELVFSMGKSVTALDSVGWFTQDQRKLLIVVARKYQLADIKKVIKDKDPDAFISITPTMGVYGRGFEQLKGGKIQWKKSQRQVSDKSGLS